MQNLKGFFFKKKKKLGKGDSIWKVNVITHFILTMKWINNIKWAALQYEFYLLPHPYHLFFCSFCGVVIIIHWNCTVNWFILYLGDYFLGVIVDIMVELILGLLKFSLFNLLQWSALGICCCLHAVQCERCVQLIWIEL